MAIPELFQSEWDTTLTTLTKRRDFQYNSELGVTLSLGKHLLP